MWNLHYYRLLQEIDITFFDLETQPYFLFESSSNETIYSNNDNADIYLCVRKNFNDFFFDCIPKGILINKDYNIVKREYPLNLTIDFFSSKVLKVFPREFYKKGSDPFKTFFYFVPSFASFYDDLRAFGDVDCYKNSRLILVKKRLALVENKIAYFHLPYELEREKVFSLPGLDLNFSFHCDSLALNLNRKLYEIFFEEVYFFGPFKSFDKSLILRVRYNADILSFKDIIITKLRV